MPMTETHAALVSGGMDSTVAADVSVRWGDADLLVYLDTGTGLEANRRYVERLADWMGVQLWTMRTHESYADDARAAIAATLQLVASNGGVQRAEIIEQIAPEHPLGYDDIGARGAWWRKVIRPALEESCQYENGVGWVQADGQ